MRRTMLLVLAAIAAMPVAAQAGPVWNDVWALPKQISETPQDNGWGSVAVTTDGAPYNLVVTIPYVSKASQIGIFPYDEAGTYRGGIVYTALNDARTAYRADIGSIPGVSVHEERQVTYGALPGGYMRLIIVVNYPPWTTTPSVGTTRWVFYVAGRDSPSWNWNLQLTPGSGATYGTPTGGSESFIAEAKDFSQETGVAVVGNVTTTSAGARANVNATYRRAISSTFVGVWLNYGSMVSCCPPLAIARDMLEITSDAGYAAPCSGWCFYTDMRGPGAIGPGAYTFRNRAGAAAGLFGFEDFILAGADIVLADPPARP